MNLKRRHGGRACGVAKCASPPSLLQREITRDALRRRPCAFLSTAGEQSNIARLRCCRVASTTQDRSPEMNRGSLHRSTTPRAGSHCRRRAIASHRRYSSSPGPLFERCLQLSKTWCRDKRTAVLVVTCGIRRDRTQDARWQPDGGTRKRCSSKRSVVMEQIAPISSSKGRSCRVRRTPA